MKIRTVAGALQRAMSRMTAGSAHRRGRVVTAMFALAMAVLVALAAFCMDVLSSARAYVGGESLWSKAEKDAVRNLMRFASSHGDDDWHGYLQAIAVPLGDRKAREQLETTSPDLAIVRQGFLEGGIHSDDIPGMIRLFRWFRHVEFLDRAIDIWAAGDRLIDELKGAADELRAAVLAGSGRDTVRPLLARVEALDQRLTPLEVRFSGTLGEASRKTQALLTTAVTAIGALLIVVAALFVRRMAQHAARYEHDLRESNERLERRVQERTRELTQANARLLELDRLKSEFLSNMSHELRTPLNAVLGFSRLLRDERSGPLNDPQKRQLGLIHSSGQRLLELIDDVLEVSRIVAGHVELHPSRFDFTELLAQIDSTMRPAVQAKGLAFVCEALSPELPVFADWRSCARVLRNLVDNAVKFTERGEIRISAGFEGGDLLVTVSDTGIGIAAEQLPLVFEAFRQLDGGPGRAHGGIGLGLYLSCKLADAMGGTIHVESSPGAGSRFSIRLPQSRA